MTEKGKNCVQKIPLKNMICPTSPPKDVDIHMGYAYRLDGKLYYADGKTRVCLDEHFGNEKKTISDLIENTIRYEARIDAERKSS